MGFFSFVGAPRVFAVLDAEEAGAVVRDIFPRYYELGLFLGGVATLALLIQGRWGKPLTVGSAVAITATAIALLATATARFMLIPRMDAAGEAAFDRYHRQSVLLNGLAMLGVLAGLIASHL